MTGDKKQFNKLDAKNGGHVTFGDNAKGKIIGIGKIGNPHSLSIHHVLLVDGLKHNLLSISQLCDMGNRHQAFNIFVINFIQINNIDIIYPFTTKDYFVFIKTTNKAIFRVESDFISHIT